MKTYDKIKNIYKRSLEGDKKLVEGMYSSDIIAALCEQKWHFTEKIDGTNVRIMWDGHSVSIGGRTERTQHPKLLLEYLEDTFCGSINEYIFEELFGGNEAVLFGEGYGANIQKSGNHYSKSPKFILFDMYIFGTFQNFSDLIIPANALRLDIVPEVGMLSLEEAVEFVKSKPKSLIAYDEDFVMEGIVGRPPIELFDKHGERAICKIKVNDFCE